MIIKIEKYYCYILTNKNRTVLYIGYTGNLKRRMKQHANGSATFYTRKYSIIDLVYFESFCDKKIAKKRERQLKNWHKEWKWNLIKEENPNLLTLKPKTNDTEINSAS